jgi:hypothetical protein
LGGHGLWPWSLGGVCCGACVWLPLVGHLVRVLGSELLGCWPEPRW